MPEPTADDSVTNADVQLFESGNLADATIVCGDRTWKVHKVILGSRCKWFKSAFYGNLAVCFLVILLAFRAILWAGEADVKLCRKQCLGRLF